MAENLVGKKYQRHEGEALHTNSNYLAGKDFNLNLNPSLTPEAEILGCERREQEVYNAFGCSSYDQLMNKIRNTFMDSPQDAWVLDQFRYENFERHLRNLANIGLLREPIKNPYASTEEETITIKIDATKANKQFANVSKKISQLAKSNENTVELTVGINSTELVQILNQFAKDKKKKTSLRRDSKAKTKMDYLRALDKILSENGEDKLFDISVGDKSVTEYYEQTFYYDDAINRTNRAFPWGFRAQDITKALSEDETGALRRQLEEAYDQLRELFTETLIQGGSPKMRRAAKVVWKQKLGDKVNESIGFFEKGDGKYLKIGAAGEYAAALLFQYLSYSFGNVQTTNQVAKILGDDSEALGVQGKIDVMLLGAYGIQVKNFGLSFRSHSKIDTNTTIDRISREGVAGQDIRIFFANYYFNESFATNENRQSQHKDFMDNLQDYMSLVYTVATNDAIKDDAVNFYLIGGKYFVPCSVILRSLGERRAKARKGIPITISSSFKRKNDDDLEKMNTKYWKNDNGKLTPTEQNTTTFDNLVGRRINRSTISIKSNIDYQYFLNELYSSRYSLW